MIEEHDIRWPQRPYPGLRPFAATGQLDESLIFFGRDRHILQLLEKLYDNRFLAVLGPSGCGKSSLVKVGLLPRLRAGYVANAGCRWIAGSMEPGRDPFRNLALCWNNLVGSHLSAPDLADFLRRERTSLLALANTAAERDDLNGRNLLLVVDQFEELFRPDLSGPEVASAFIDRLLHVHYSRPGRLYITITLRSDDTHKAALFPGLPDAFNESTFLVPHMSRGDIEEAIRRPLALEPFQATIDDALVQKLLEETRDSPVFDQDRLSLLQFCLALLWERGGGDRQLSMQDYSAIAGGEAADLREVLTREANDRIRSLGQKEAIAKTMFSLMVQPLRSGGVRRRVSSMTEVAESSGRDLSEVESVLAVFGADEERTSTPFVRRLEPNGTTLDLVHESIARQWEYFRPIEKTRTGQMEDLNHLEGLRKRGKYPSVKELRDWRRFFRDGRTPRSLVSDMGFDYENLRVFVSSRVKRATFRGLVILLGSVAVAAIGASALVNLVDNIRIKEQQQQTEIALNLAERVVQNVNAVLLAPHIGANPALALEIAVHLYKKRLELADIHTPEGSRAEAVLGAFDGWIEQALTDGLVRTGTRENRRIGTHVNALEIIPIPGASSYWLATGAIRPGDLKRSGYSMVRFNRIEPQAADEVPIVTVVPYPSDKRSSDQSTINSVEWNSATSRLLAAGSDGFISVISFDPKTGRHRTSRKISAANRGMMSSGVWGPNGTYVLWTSWRKLDGEGGYGTFVGINEDEAGDWLAPTIIYEEVSQTRKLPTLHANPFREMFALGTSRGLYVFELERDGEGRIVRTCEVPLNPEKPFEDETVTAVRWDDSGTRLAVGTSSGVVVTYRLDTFTRDMTMIPSARSGPGGQVLSLAWSPNGRFLATGGLDQVLRVWDVQSGALLLSTLLGSQVSALAWDGTVRKIFAGLRYGNLGVRAGDDGFVMEIDERVIAGSETEKLELAEAHLARDEIRKGRRDRSELCRRLAGDDSAVCSDIYGTQ